MFESSAEKNPTSIKAVNAEFRPAVCTVGALVRGNGGKRQLRSGLRVRLRCWPRPLSAQLAAALAPSRRAAGELSSQPQASKVTRVFFLFLQALLQLCGRL